MSKLDYRLRISSELTVKEIEDFIKVFNDVFETEYNTEWFKWKYLKNIYGDSYMVIVYDGIKPIAVRSFWRNDIYGKRAYQPCDTAVIKDYRGKGIFSKMTKLVLNTLEDELIYNYPNDNSYPGYVKLGWKVKHYYYLKLVISKKRLYSQTDKIEDEYFKWKFLSSPTSNYYYTKYKDKSYLLYKRTSNIYYVLGRFNSDIEHGLEKVDVGILFSYTTKETLMYKLIKNRARIVSYDKNDKYGDVNIPVYKGDFF